MNTLTDWSVRLLLCLAYALCVLLLWLPATRDERESRRLLAFGVSDLIRT